jgi:hypothetical protein
MPLPLPAALPAPPEVLAPAPISLRAALSPATERSTVLLAGRWQHRWQRRRLAAGICIRSVTPARNGGGGAGGLDGASGRFVGGSVACYAPLYERGAMMTGDATLSCRGC